MSSSSRTHRVRFLLPDKPEDWNDSAWSDPEEVKTKFDLKISRLVVPPPPKISPRVKNPDELLIELRNKLLAIDRTIHFRDAIFEEEEEEKWEEKRKDRKEEEEEKDGLQEERKGIRVIADSQERTATTATTSTVPSSSGKPEVLQATDDQQSPQEQQQPRPQQQEQRLQPQRQQPQQRQLSPAQPNDVSAASTSAPGDRPSNPNPSSGQHNVKDAAGSGPAGDPASRVGSKRPPLPPKDQRPQTARPDSSRGAKSGAGLQTTATAASATAADFKRQDSLPKSFKTRRRSFRDFSKRQFRRALSAMNISRSSGRGSPLSPYPHSSSSSSSLDLKTGPGSGVDRQGSGRGKGKPLAKSSSSSSLLLVSRLGSRLRSRFPSNAHRQSPGGGVADLPRGGRPLERGSSWSRLFSSWSSNLQSCTRVQTDD